MTFKINSIQKQMCIALAALFLVASPFVFSVATAHADDLGGEVDTYTPDDTYYPDTSSTYYPDTSTDYYPDTSSSYYPDTSSYTSGYLGGSGYTGSGYTGSGYLIGGGYSTSGYSTPGYSNSNTNVNTNTNVIDNGNSCTASDSCDTTISNTSAAPVINDVIDNPSPVVYSNPAPAPYVYNNPAICDTCGCPGYSTCSQPVAYNTAPYVTLSQVPYTGLDLSTWELVVYWSFLVLWCLAAAYLIVIKRVQNRIFNSIYNFLLGTSKTSTVSKSAPQVVVQSQNIDINALATQIAALISPKVAIVNSAPVVDESDRIDSFVLSQINRAHA